MKKAIPSLGGDPEFFIFYKSKGEYKIISADKVLPSKNKKRVVSNYGYCFFDGVQAEINPQHHTCREIFGEHIRHCLNNVYNSTKGKYRKDIYFAPLASVKIKPEDVSGCDKECFRFGCSPDSSIYTDKQLKYPDGHEFMTRFSGGHIHLGFSDIEYMKKMKGPKKLTNLIRVLDILPGIMSVCLSHGEEEEARREWYGKAGTYRIQEHGIEYRTPSSFWIVSPQMVSLFTSFYRDAFNIVYNNMEENLFSQVNKEEIRNIIDDVKYDKAKDIYFDIIEPMYKKFPSITGVPMKYDYVRNFVKLMIEEGYQYVFNPFYMLNYWNLKAPYLERGGGFNMEHGIRHFVKDLNYGYKKIEKIRNIGGK